MEENVPASPAKKITLIFFINHLSGRPSQQISFPLCFGQKPMLERNQHCIIQKQEMYCARKFP
jgi:hypothetical protein